MAFRPLDVIKSHLTLHVNGWRMFASQTCAGHGVFQRIHIPSAIHMLAQRAKPERSLPIVIARLGRPPRCHGRHSRVESIS
jgi:hypothetical protein